MSVFDSFLDSMYGQEVRRKRMLSQVDNSFLTSILAPAASHKRPKNSPPRAISYILTERETSVADFQRELNADNEKSTPSTLQFDPSFNERKALKEELASSEDGHPTSTPDTMSESPSGIPSFTYSLPSSANPSPIISFNEQPVHSTPSVSATDLMRSIPVLQVTGPDEIPDWSEHSQSFEAKTKEVVSPGPLLVLSSQALEVEHCVRTSLEDEDSAILSELEGHCVIDAYFE
ncbi:hypothetical protein DFH28DRAFT_1134999 [Melampsora americana]|nr:hypothetical protein DFH28DRAFT_1134999 [Melampsora americana]